MPRMDGTTFLQTIRNDHRFKEIVVSIMTTTENEAIRLNVDKMPFTFYILKPVDTDKFLNLIKKAIGHLPEEIINLINQARQF